jgi:hypothetical protein
MKGFLYTIYFKLLYYLDWLINLSLSEQKLDFEMVKQPENNIKCKNEYQLKFIFNLDVINVVELLFFNCQLDSL